MLRSDGDKGQASILSVDDSGLISRVKIISSDGTPVVFNIISREMLDTDSQTKHNADCDELTIVADGISLEDDVCSTTLDMTWLCHFLTEKKKKEKVTFDRLTINEYYKYLMSSNSYEIEEGRYAEIVKCDEVGDKILLYKTPIEEREIPYHIAVISKANGKLIRNRTSSFDNKNKAIDNYSKRLSCMRLQLAKDIHDERLPF